MLNAFKAGVIALIAAVGFASPGFAEFASTGTMHNTVENGRPAARLQRFATPRSGLRAYGLGTRPCIG